MKISTLFVGLILMIQERLIFAEDTNQLETLATNKYAYEITADPQVQIETKNYLEKFDTFNEVQQVNELKVLAKSHLIPELIDTIEVYNKNFKTLKDDFNPIIEQLPTIKKEDIVKGSFNNVWNNVKELVIPVLGELNLHDTLMPILEEKIIDIEITRTEAEFFIQAIRSLSSTVRNTIKKMTEDNQYVIKVAIKATEEKFIEKSNELNAKTKELDETKAKLRILEESKTAEESKTKDIRKQEKTLETEITDLRADILTQQTAYTTLLATYSTIQEKYNTEIDSIKKEIEKLKSNAGTDAETIRKSQDKQKELENEQNKLKTKHETALAELAVKAEEITKLNNQITQLTTDVKNAKQETESAKNELRDARADVLKGSTSSTNDAKKIKDLEESVTKTVNKQLDLQKQLDAANKALGEITSLKTEITSLKTELQECQEINKDCQIMTDVLDASATILPGLGIAFLVIYAIWGCFRGKQQAKTVYNKADVLTLQGKIDDKQYAESVKNWPGFSIFMRPKEELPDIDYEKIDDEYSRWIVDAETNTGYPTSMDLLYFIEKNLPVIFNIHYKKKGDTYEELLPFNVKQRNEIDNLIETRKKQREAAMEKKKKNTKSK